MKEPNACTACETPTALTPDWTLWPWPDDAWLCTPCNDARHEREDYADVEHRTQDPHCTCNDCIAYHAAQSSAHDSDTE